MIASFGDRRVEYTRKQDRDCGIFRLQYDQYGMSRPTQNGSSLSKLGLPDTVKGVIPAGEPDFTLMTEIIQRWMYQLCRERVPSMSETEAKQSWRSLFSDGSDGSTMSQRAFTDYAGSHTHADYINGNNLDAGDMKLKNILTGGAWVEFRGWERIGGQDAVKISAIDPAGDFTAFHPRTHKHLFFYPTISRREPIKDVNGKTVSFHEYVSIPFPQFSDKSVIPIFARPGRDYVWMPANRFQFMSYPPNPFRNVSYGYQYPNPYEGL